MTEAWFSPDVARSFAFMSLLAIAAALEPIAQQGRFRALVMAVFRTGTALGATFLIAGLMGWLAGQPAYVFRSLLLVGVTVTIPFVAGFLQIQKVYRDVELRKTVAADL